jgi:hypothetical protein
MKMANPAAKRLIAKRLGRFFLPFLEVDLRFFPIASPFYSEKVRPPGLAPLLDPVVTQPATSVPGRVSVAAGALLCAPIRPNRVRKNAHLSAGVRLGGSSFVTHFVCGPGFARLASGPYFTPCTTRIFQQPANGWQETKGVMGTKHGHSTLRVLFRIPGFTGMAIPADM